MISIIMPALIDSIDKLEWLNEAIWSVQQQDFNEWELIIVDDCSPHPLTIEKPDDRIRKFRLTNQSGPALARNTGVALAQYDAILPLDADDMLFVPDALSRLYEVWKNDKSLIVYGDLQRLDNKTGQWIPGKIFSLPQYTFQGALDPRAIIPVTALHSKECHLKAGGWKREIRWGLEDVEYWIAAGKAGFCGKKIPQTTLVYRKHEKSRSFELRRVNRQEAAMRTLIQEMHKDVYEGRYPVGCCGGRSSYSSIPAPAQRSAKVSTLDQYDTTQKVWIQYNGKRKASFGMIGQFTSLRYDIQGPGHKLEVHVGDLPKFRRSGRGQDFTIGVARPENNGTEPKPKEITMETFQAPQPQVGQVERLDKVALNG